MKKVLVSSAVAAFIFTGCASGIAQLANSGMTQQLAQSVTTTSVSAKNADAIAKNANGGACIPRLGGGSVGFTGMISKMAINAAIESALKSVDGLEDIKMPAKIMDTCVADARLKYVETISNRYFENQNTVNEKILQAMEQSDEVKKLLAEIKDKKNIAEKADHNERITEQTDKIQELLEKNKLKDKKLVSEARGIYTMSMMKYAPMIIAWNKEIADFTQDNLPWGIKNVGSLKIAMTQLSAVAMSLKNAVSGLDKAMTRDGLKYDKNAGRKAARSIKKIDKKVLEAASKDFDNAFKS